MKKAGSIFVMLATMAVATSIASSQPTCQCSAVTCGGLQVLYNNLRCVNYTCTSGPNGIDIVFNGADPCQSNSANIIITPQLQNIRINSITINMSGALSDRILLNILTSTGGSIIHVGSVTKTGSGDLWIADIRCSGTIGGAWTGNSINEIIADGDISASFTSTGSTGTGVPGDIALVRSTGGSITGSLNSNGFISDVEAINGNIGVSFSPSLITSRNGIRKIDAGTVYANINTRNSGGQGDLWYLKARAGPFVGTINTTNIQSSAGNKGLDIAGNLDANISITNWFTERAFIDGTFVSGRTLTTGSNGIRDQVILNRDNNGFVWNGNVTVGTTPLSPLPYYDNAPSVLGGGAIGLAPFMVHYEACNPVAAGDPQTALGPCTAHVVSGAPLTRVSITHYGPVGLWDGTLVGGVRQILNANPTNPAIDGFTVEVADDTNCTWVDVTNSFLTKYIGGNHRTFDIEGPFNSGPCFVNKFYRIRPVREFSEGARYPLVCRDVDGNPLVGNYEYIIKVEPPNCAPPPEDP